MGARSLIVLSGALVPWLGASGCQSAKVAKAEIVTQVEMVRPASERPRVAAVTSVAPAAVDPVDEAAEFCRQVERQARDTNASLPKRLDPDTKATRVAAFGCDVVLEYAMLDLTVDEVAADGMREMRSDVLQKLCSDRGARGVLDHGGSFTNVYRDEKSALIDQFTITIEDCPDHRSADRRHDRVDL
jgi:hypothetical protein